MAITGKQMLELLKANGFRKESQKGSHVKMKNDETKKQTVVPVHSNKDLDVGTANAILKQAGLK